MDRNKSQAWNFAFEAIPAIFHSQTTNFWQLLERDNLKFLEFWWNYVGEQLPDDKCRPFEQVNYKILDVDEKTKLVIICLPEATEDGDMIYLGMFSKPSRYFAWVRLPSTRVVALVRRDDPKFERGTELGDVTPRMIFVPLGSGPVPNEEIFTQIVVRLAKGGPVKESLY